LFFIFCNHVFIFNYEPGLKTGFLENYKNLKSPNFKTNNVQKSLIRPLKIRFLAF